jgi:hypothetical protein
VYLPGTFSKVVEILSDNKIDAVYSNLYFGDKELNITRKFLSHRPKKWFSLFHCFIPSATFFMKRKIVDNNIFINKNKNITMDKDYFARILYAGYKVKYVDDFFSIFRWHENNKSLDTKKIRNIRAREGFETFLEISKFKLPVNKVTTKIYFFLVNLFRIYRFVLKKMK